MKAKKRRRKPTRAQESCSDMDCTTCLHLPTLDEIESGAVMLLEEPASLSPPAVEEASGTT